MMWSQKLRGRVLIAVFVAVVMGVVGWYLYDLRRQLDEARAQVMISEGTVTFGESGKLAVGDEVAAGTRVRTGAGGKVDIGLRGLGAVRLGEDSEIVIDRIDDKGSVLEIKKGRVFNRLRKLPAGSGFELKAPTGQIMVRGTEFFVEADGGEMLVAVRSGEVEAGDHGGEKQSVGGGKMVVVGENIGEVVAVGDRESKLFENLDDLKMLPEDLATLRPEPGKMWRNELGMEFLPVEGLARTLVSKNETRLKDFEAFVAATGRSAGDLWRDPGFAQTPDHPVCAVNWGDAVAFCDWMTARERKRGLLRPGDGYRLPTRGEWLMAAGGEEAVALMGAPSDPPLANLSGHKDDGYERHAPVGSFPTAAGGAFDLVGNVGEWSEDRGAPHVYDGGKRLTFGSRYPSAYTKTRSIDLGFRPVLALGSEQERQLALDVESRFERLAQDNADSSWIPSYRIREGKVILNFGGKRDQLRDLSALAGLPISELYLWGCPVGDLSPLRGMPLEYLYLPYNNEIRDLSPLRGLPLKRLSIYASPKVKDLSPLAGLPLEHLDIGHSSDLDLSPLSKVPLKWLSLDDNRISNFEPLASNADLRLLGDSTGTVFYALFVAIRSGDRGAAIEWLGRFVEKMSGSSAFDKYLQPASDLLGLLKWAEDGQRGAPPGAKPFEKEWYVALPKFASSWKSNAELAGLVGGHLPVFATEAEYQWFRDNVATDFWLGLERTEGEGWRWVTGEPLSYQAPWSENDQPGEGARCSRGKTWHPAQKGSGGMPLAIEWETEAIQK